MNKLIILVVLLLLAFTKTQHIEGADMESARFKIESGTVSFDVSDNTDTPSQNNNFDRDAELFKKDGIIIKTDGLSDTSIPFQINMEKTLLTMENVSPGVASEVSTAITVTGGRSVYQVLATEAHELKKLSGEIIPDTSCNHTCTINQASVWNSVSSFGFGYSIQGEDIPTDFKSNIYYRPFPNMKKTKKEAILMKSTNKSAARRANLNVKTVISAVQPDGTYETTLNITALPGY